MVITKRFVAITTLVLFLCGAIFGVAHAQDIQDWYRLRGYAPPASISQIVKDDTMTPYAEKVLKVTRPILESDNAKFRQACPQTEQTIVLGCYHSGISFISSDSSLFVYNVSDNRLSGVQQVTMAHEMLHAAYDRLNPKERERVDGMLLDFYNKSLQDQRVIETINSYKKSEPADVVNEMHSIFGTEITSLPAPLENYYKQYFSNRQAVTSFADKYEDEFASRTNAIKSYDQQLSQLRRQIEQEEQQLRAQLDSLQSDRARVERSDDQAVINSYNSRVIAYNNGVARLQADITAYNSLVEKRNSLAAELQSLQSSLDSRLTTQPAQ